MKCNDQLRNSVLLEKNQPFNVEINSRSNAVAGNNTETFCEPFTQFPLKVAFFKTMVLITTRILTLT